MNLRMNHIQKIYQQYLHVPEKMKGSKKYISHKNREFCLPTCYMKIEEAELIMCGSENGQIYVWDSNSQQVLYTVPVKRAHEKSFKSVVAVTTGRNNNAIVSFFLNKIDHELKVWRYSEHK